MRPLVLRTALRSWRNNGRIARHQRGVAHFGQPLHETHPHLLRSGELTPGITSVEYHERRAKLAKSLPDKSVAVFASADLKYRSGPVFYEYKQDPDFYYLTGFTEPDSLAVIEKVKDDYRFHLFVRPKDPRAESWDGARSGVDAAKDVFNADEAARIDDVLHKLPPLLKHAEIIYTNLPTPDNPSSQTALQKAFRTPSAHPLTTALQSLSPSKSEIRSCRTLLNALRVVKSPAEVAVMRRAGQESGRVITDAMRSGPFASEKELWTFIEGGFRMRGLDGSAYLPVVAGGTNGLMIHYVRNDHLLQPTDLVLLDGAGEYGGYASDITRTWPQNLKFSAAQRDLYQLLLNVQRTCVALCREDAQTSLDGIHKVAEAGLKDGLRDLGFELGTSAAGGHGLEVLYPHHVGHHVGLDVHDCSGVARTGKLVAGNCITIEPGIYVPVDDRWPKHFQGMAMRIEDSVCVTEESPYVLTTEAVKEIVDIEALKS